MILAGGRGSRLRLVLPYQPKVMAEFHGRPFLAYLLDQLVAWGVQKVVLCTGYRGEEIRTRLGDAYGPVPLTYFHEDEPLGTGGALRLALPLLDSDPVMVMNGDSLIEADLQDYLAWFLGPSNLASISYLVAQRFIAVRQYGFADHRAAYGPERCIPDNRQGSLRLGARRDVLPLRPTRPPGRRSGRVALSGPGLTANGSPG